VFLSIIPLLSLYEKKGGYWEIRGKGEKMGYLGGFM